MVYTTGLIKRKVHERASQRYCGLPSGDFVCLLKTCLRKYTDFRLAALGTVLSSL
jgi:hypothetical protein